MSQTDRASYGRPRVISQQTPGAAIIDLPDLPTKRNGNSNTGENAGDRFQYGLESRSGEGH